MSVETQRESLLNAPALLFMSAVVLIAFWILFPRQPAFRDPANLSAKDALSVAYLRVLVQSDPGNAPLRLSFVQVLTEAGMTDEAVLAMEPLQNAPESGLTYEIRLAELKLALQQLYRHPPRDVEASLRRRIGELVPLLLRLADNDKESNQVVLLAEQFGEPSVVAETFEQLAGMQNETRQTKSRWLAFAAKQRLAAAQPRAAAQNFCRAFTFERIARKKTELAKACLGAYLQAGVDREALKAAMQILSAYSSSNADAQLLLLAADVAQPMGDRDHALVWLEQASAHLPADQRLAERVVRLQVSMGLLSEGLARAPMLRASLIPGSERQRLLAHLYDWNGQPDEALALWLSFARHKADEEAETRAFALAQAKPDNEAIVQLLEAVMSRRKLTTTEADAYVKAGLAVAQPSRVEKQLRRHAERFGNPPPILNALVEVLVLQGKPDAALTLYEDMPEIQDGRQRLALARLYEEAGNTQKSFQLLLRDIDSPPPASAEEYWLLLAKVSTQLGQDAYAGQAYEKALALRPNDVEILENLQRLALRHHDEKKSERLARYGWERLKRIEDLQRLMRFSWKRRNWDELDQWLEVAEKLPSAAQARDYWYFQSMRRMAHGEQSAARGALQEILKLQAADPEVTEAMIWLLLAYEKIDRVLLDSVVAPYRAQTASQSTVNPALAEALAAAEQGLGRPVQAAAWFLRSLSTRAGDFLWILALADNMEWAGCPAHANYARFQALEMFASRQNSRIEVRYPSRLAEYFFGSKYLPPKREGTEDAKKQEELQSIRDQWGFGGKLDNADYFALRREVERLELSQWKDFAKAVRNRNEREVERQLALISDHLKRQPAAASHPDMLPLSIDDVDRANRWLAGEPEPNPSDLATELDICRETLTKIREFPVNSEPAKR
ncbi:tetratricopeptide repeat protein [Nitrosospira multiformis]|uniref:tetratricopeptide repeat protein n=1 Tax=Nitrosospira multiformis TaxID=1231 RepID=UPI00089CC8F1|nr:tetratricopeptide repeat protein [Nitrosospira multiformis]SEA55218.1 Tetratricopeptide repeat-containing protein [Nitrosospira multiformis]